jgi:TonB-dependent SusC/RagA subfamily outer membrane receptor
LKEDSEMLDEVVVTGYGGKQLRTKVTNSISKVSEESLKVGVFSNPAQALSGAVSGLKVTQSSGNPGSTPTIVLRGGTEWDGSGSPLVMVDGQLRDGLNDINPEDIESMEVLKDAGATALYGARASNGVILITTKTGKVGKAEINLKAKVGMNYINNPYDFLGAKDFITAWKSHFTLPLLGKYDCPLWPRYDCPFWFK